MHEMAITESILRISIRAAEEKGASKIRKISLAMGEFSDIVPVIFKEYFKILARGTIAEDSEIKIRRIPVTVKCRSCGYEGRVDKRHIFCPECGGRDLSMTGGREFLVESLEAE